MPDKPETFSDPEHAKKYTPGLNVKHGKIYNIHHDNKHFGHSTLCLTMGQATATWNSEEHGEETIEILSIIPAGISVRHKRTGNEFRMSPQDIIDLAIDAGLTKDPEEIYTECAVLDAKRKCAKDAETKETGE